VTLVGIDVGTTWCKAALVAEDGREIVHHRVHTPWNQVASGAEIEPARLLTAALEACAGALAAAPTAAVAGVGVTSMAETGVLIDAGGEPVANAIAWHDQRGTDEMRVLTPALGGAARFGQVTGLPPSPLCTLAKYAWLRERAPASANGVRWLNVAEWVVRSLGGEELADLSLASRTGMLDLDRASPWDESLDAVRAPPGLLPQLAPSGTPAGRVSRGLEQAEGAILCTAGHDHLCAAIGAGATGDDDVFDSCGTAEALIRALPPSSSARLRPRALAAEVTVGWHALPGRHALLAAFLGGLALRRLGALLGTADEESRHALEAGAADAEAAGSGAAVLAARSIAELPSGADPPAVWRAALEAQAATARTKLDRLDSLAGPHRRVIAAGGGVRSDAALDARRRAFGPSRLERPDVGEAGARGAALLAGVAAGVYDDVRSLPTPAQGLGATQ
jgi:sugar (pentulose or hexulose) kinase